MNFCARLKRFSLSSNFHFETLGQSALLHTKHSRLGNKAPITLFTSLPCNKPFGFTKQTREIKYRYVEPDSIDGYQRFHINELSVALEGMHKTAREISSKELERRVASDNKKTGVKPCNFEVGDYVLRGAVRKRQQKLLVRWTGPMLVTNRLSDFLF